MAKPDRRLTVRLSDGEAELIERVRAAQPHLTRSDVFHLAMTDNHETMAAALRAVPASTRVPVRLTGEALARLDAVAEGLASVGGELRPLRSLANQIARASNSGDPLVAGQLAGLTEAVEACLGQLAEVAHLVAEGASWAS